MQRDKRIDIIKGLAIILMVLGHSGFAGKKYIYLFHMAVFFMASGYLFKPDYEGKIKGIVNYIWKKVKGIWLPYFIWNAVFTLLNNVFITLHIYSDTPFEAVGLAVTGHSFMSPGQMAKNIIKGVAMLGRTEMGGAFWFLRTLFALSILFCIVDYVLFRVIKSERVRNVFHLLIAVGFGGVGYMAHLLDVKSLSVPIVLSSYLLYYAGYAIKKYGVMSVVPRIAGTVVGFVVLLVCTYVGPAISVGDNSYGNPLYLLLCSFAGWCLLYGIAELMDKFSKASVIAYIGQNTLPIVIHHFWCFKVVHLLQIVLYGYPMKYLSSFPYLNCEKGWWLLYLLVGVAMPILLQMAWLKIKNTSKLLFQNR